MTKKELADRMLEQTGGNPFITINGLIRLFHTSYKNVVNLTEELIPISSKSTRSNKAKYYFVDDVAGEIMRKGL